jgi:hypothetical protein
VREIYDSIGGPLYAVHFNGWAYAMFSGPNQALAYWRGLDARSREYFHIENEDGERVVLKDQPHHPGHASAILAALDKASPSDEER